MANRLKDPAEWQPDIDRSVADYDEWYLAESPSTRSLLISSSITRHRAMRVDERGVCATYGRSHRPKPA
jgi:hypothetical protein